MTDELHWLTLTVLMTALLWVPYFVDRVATRGLWPTVQGTAPEHGQGQSAWGLRAIRAHQNAVENLAIFVPAVLVAYALQISTPVTRAAVAVYFVARLAHYVVYTLGVPLGRTLAFTAGWAAQVAILVSILGWL
jgi:uncharacterized MAPEG superfamily protein